MDTGDRHPPLAASDGAEAEGAELARSRADGTPFAAPRLYTVAIWAWTNVGRLANASAIAASDLKRVI
jgi:hypothetical protein